MTTRAKRVEQGGLKRALRTVAQSLLLIGCGGGLLGCDDPLPGFANPPPYDAGDSGDDAGLDDDAG